MKFKIDPSAIADKISKLVKIVNDRNYSDIYGFLLVNVVDGFIDVTAMNTESRITIRIPIVENDSVFSFCIEANIFLKLLPSSIGEVAFTINPDTFEIEAKHGSGKRKVVGRSDDDFPAAYQPEKENCSITIPTNLFIHAFYKTNKFVSKDNNEPALSCIYLDIEEQAINFVATNHWTLSIYREDISLNIVTNVLLKINDIPIISSFFEKGSDLKIIIDKRRIYFKSGTTRAYIARVESKYENYKAIISKSEYPISFSIDKKLLHSAINRSLIAASKEAPIAKFELTAGHLKISSKDVEFATGFEETVGCREIDGTILFEIKTTELKKILETTEGSYLKFKLKDDKSLIAVTSDIQQEQFFIMPFIL